VDERPEEKAPGVDDLPYVDGSAMTSEELRAEVARATDPEVQRIEEVREDLAATTDELRSRLDVRRQASQRLSQAWPVVVAVAGLLAAVVVWRRRSRRSDAAG
jgi:ABC-type transporter Mla subunit MlaD